MEKLWKGFKIFEKETFLASPTLQEIIHYFVQEKGKFYTDLQPFVWRCHFR